MRKGGIKKEEIKGSCVRSKKVGKEENE